MRQTAISNVVRRILLCLPLLAVALGAKAACREQSAFELAARAYRQSDWETAAAQFQQMLPCAANIQRQHQIRFYLAECQMQLGQYASAQQNYQEVIQSAGQELANRALFRSGEAALFAGNEHEAENLLQQFLDANRESPSASYAWMYLGELAESRGDFVRATASFRSVARQYPDSPHAKLARLALARVMLADGRSEQVAKVLGGDPANPGESISAEALLLLGRAEFDQQRYEQALKHFREVAKQFPDSAASHRARIAAAWALWRLEWFETIEDEIVPLAHQPSWVADYHYLLGMAAYGKKDWPTGNKHLAKALALRPDHPSHDALLFYQGVCYLRRDRVEAAESVLERLCAEHPNSAWRDDALWELSRLARSKQPQAGHTPTAERRHDQAPTNETISSFYDIDYDIEISPQPEDNLLKAQTLLDEAVGLERDGHFHRAIAGYNELIELQPTNPIVHEGIWRNARLHQRLKRNGQAKLLFERLLTEDPTSVHVAESLATLAQLELAGGNENQARKHSGLLLEKFPQSAQAVRASYWLARLAADENDSESALQHLAAALDSLEVLETPEQHLFAQIVVLKCQLLAQNEQWQGLREFATEVLSQIQTETESVKIEFWLAEAEFRTRQFDKARTRFEKLQPRTTGIQEDWVAMVPLRRAQLVAQRLQWKETLKLLVQLERNHPEFALQFEVDYLRGRALAGRGKMSTARDYYKEVLRNSPILSRDSGRGPVDDWRNLLSSTKLRNSPPGLPASNRSLCGRQVGHRLASPCRTANRQMLGTGTKLETGHRDVYQRHRALAQC